MLSVTTTFSGCPFVTFPDLHRDKRFQLYSVHTLMQLRGRSVFGFPLHHRSDDSVVLNYSEEQFLTDNFAKSYDFLKLLPPTQPKVQHYAELIMNESMNQLMSGVSFEKSTSWYLPFFKVLYRHLLSTITDSCSFVQLPHCTLHGLTRFLYLLTFAEAKMRMLTSTLHSQIEQVILAFAFIARLLLFILLRMFCKKLLPHCWLAFVWSTFRVTFSDCSSKDPMNYELSSFVQLFRRTCNPSFHVLLLLNFWFVNSIPVDESTIIHFVTVA